MSSVSATVLIAGRYRLDRQVATDRFGEVWHGTDVELARPVAVKLLHADAGDADMVSQFRAAACRAASLTHEGLVRVFDYCEPEPSDSEQRPFQVMEYVDGQSLAAQLQAGPLGAARTVDIVAQVSAALQAVHQAALAHGDIRPEKILLRRDGAAKVFGFSGTCPAGSAAIGADLRALGVLARECLGEPTSPGAASVGTLVAELCADPSTDDADATTAIARRAAALRAQLGAGGDGALSASQLASSTQPLARVRARRTPAMRGIVVAVGTTAVIAIALITVAIFGARPNGSTTGADGAIQATAVRVNAAQLIGRPVGVVRLRLQRLGLVARIR
jgi:eukaryotic-like serine/threonine-protein kinase